MSNDPSWLADVRRWCRAGARDATVASIDEVEPDALGYEAAHPALQSRHWPEALGDETLDLR